MAVVGRLDVVVRVVAGATVGRRPTALKAAPAALEKEDIVKESAGRLRRILLMNCNGKVCGRDLRTSSQSFESQAGKHQACLICNGALSTSKEGAGR